ncbi:hypothetical protein [uncultured Tateyamaria sp.]|uniref:hypothetical protein n=1 Tax=uncultured Tateyamaria sp. TaxID=455651 RepID=UPI00262B07F8|nr:hypothetical protein [uncultured Tateyamaria sp.]
MMLPTILLALATILAVEVALRVRLDKALPRAIQSSKRAVQIIGARHISDHWKEKALPVYAMRIFGASMLLFVMLMAILMPFVITDMIGRLFDIHVMDRLLTIWGTMASMALGLFWLFLRNRVRRGGL